MRGAIRRAALSQLPELSMGSKEGLHVDAGLFMYRRTYGAQSCIVAASFSREARDLSARGEVLLSTAAREQKPRYRLLPLEGSILRPTE